MVGKRREKRKGKREKKYVYRRKKKKRKKHRTAHFCIGLRQRCSLDPRRLSFLPLHRRGNTYSRVRARTQPWRARMRVNSRACVGLYATHARLRVAFSHGTNDRFCQTHRAVSATGARSKGRFCPARDHRQRPRRFPRSFETVVRRRANTDRDRIVALCRTRLSRTEREHSTTNYQITKHRTNKMNRVNGTHGTIERVLLERV